MYLRVPTDGGWHTVDSNWWDDEGEFYFEDVPPGTYSILAVKRNIGKHILEEVEVQAHTITDVGDLPLNMGGALRGRLIDSNGDGVAGWITIGVEARSYDLMSWNRESIDTDDDGAFEFRGMLPGEYHVGYRAPRRMDVETKFTYPMDFLELRFPQGGTIRGTVVGADGMSLVEAEVNCVPLTDELRELSDDRPEPLFSMIAFMSAPMTQGGHFELSHMPPGHYMVAAWSFDMAAVGFAYDIEVRDGEITETGPIRMIGSGSISVTVRRDGENEPDVPVWLYDRAMNRIYHGSTDDGRQVLFRRLTPGQYTVLLEAEDEENFPDSRTITVRAGETAEVSIDIAGKDETGLEFIWTGDPDDFAYIMILQDQQPRSILRESYFEDDGSARIAQLKPGRYFVMLGDWRENIFQRRGPFEVRAGEMTRVPLSYARYRVAGRVTVPGDARFWAGGVSVRLAEVDSPLSPLELVSFTPRETVRPDGSFEFQNVADGEYILTASIPGFGHVQERVSVRGRSVAGLELALPGAEGALRVLVTDFSPHHWPEPESTRVQLWDARGHDVLLATRSHIIWDDDAEGIAPGVYTLRFHAPGYLPVVREGVEIRNAEVTLVAVRLERVGELRVVALNPEITGPRLQRSRVTLFDAEGARIEPITHPLDVHPDDYAADILPGGYYGYEHAILPVRNLGPDVKRVRVEVPGYEPLDIPYSHTPGTNRRHNATFTPAE